MHVSVLLTPSTDIAGDDRGNRTLGREKLGNGNVLQVSAVNFPPARQFNHASY